MAIRRKQVSEVLPPVELAMMQVLWERGPSTVQEVQERLVGEQAYTTVQTMLNIMVKKGRVKRVQEPGRGKAFVYSATLAQETAMGTAVEDLVQRVFGGRVEGLLMNLVEREKVSEETIAKLKKAIEEKEKKG